MAFADHLPLDMFARLNAMGPGLDRDRIEKTVSSMALGHFQDMVRQGRVGHIAGIKGRDIRVATAWNATIDDERVDWYWTLSQKLGHAVLIAGIAAQFAKGRDHDLPLSDQENTEAHAELCTLMDAGDLNDGLLGRGAFDELQDSRTGDRCRLIVKGWQPRLERLQRDPYAWTAVEDVEEIPTQTIEIDLPSGDILMTDYLRIESFREGLDARLEHRLYGDRTYSTDYSIGTDAGSINLLEATWQEGRVLEVRTDNTSVSVFQSPEGRLTVVDATTRSGDGAPRVRCGRKIGRFSCDRWTVLVMDRQDVLAIMAEGGSADPTAELDAFLASDDCYAEDTLSLKVAPGKWRVTYGPRFDETCDRKTLGIGPSIVPWFAMEPIA